MNKLVLKSRWVFSKREDLIWVIFPTLVGFLIISLYYLITDYLKISENVTILVLYLSWALLFDGTHAFATYSRTYLDKEFFSQNKPLLLKSLLVFLVGPIFILSFYFLNNNQNEASISFIIFNRFAICYAYYHLIRQHWGFLVIYRKKNNEPDDITRKLDGYLLALGTIYPFLHGQIDKIKIIHISETLNIPFEQWGNVAFYLIIIGTIIFALSFIEKLRFKEIGLHVVSTIMIVSSLVIFLVKTFTLSAILFYSSAIVAIFFVCTLLYYLRLILTRNYNPINNIPKWILLFTVIISYNIIFHLDIPILILIAAITVFHNIQYHKIINFHNVNKYKENEKDRYGIAVTLAQKLSVFIVFALLFNLFSYLPRIASNVLITNLLLNYVLSAFFWGVAFHHYYLDSVIWKIKGNKQLNKNLKISNK